MTHTGIYPFEVVFPEQSRLSCLEPDYKERIPPRLTRRMSRVVKMGVASALAALRDAGVEQPDAIITGTGFGCMSDTEKFLESISEHQERFLNPAPFIHSTHNTISSQIALLIKGTGYNQTFTHGPFSFESALLDGLMLLEEKTVQSVLVGGVDEMTPKLFAVTNRFGCWKRRISSGENPFNDNSKGAVAGEGAVFLLLKKEKSTRSYARVEDVTTRLGVMSTSDFESWLIGFLSKNDLSPADIDLCLLGKSGDNRYDAFLTRLEKHLFNRQVIIAYKQWCGEYLTSSAFAVWLSANILKHRELPAGVIAESAAGSAVKSILLVNRYQSRHQSLILLQAC